MAAARKRNWTREHEIERLVQLRADVDSAWGRYITECLRMVTVKAAPEDQAEWIHKTEQAEAQRDWMLRDCDMWIEVATNANAG